MLIRVFADFFQPFFQIDERLLIRDVINQESTDSKPIMNRRNTQELLCPRGIPYLGSHSLVTIRKRHCSELKLYAIRRLGLLLKESFRDTQHEVCFADGFVTNYDDFVEVVETFLWIIKGSTILMRHTSLKIKRA